MTRNRNQRVASREISMNTNLPGTFNLDKNSVALLIQLGSLRNLSSVIISGMFNGLIFSVLILFKESNFVYEDGINGTL